MHTPRLLAVGSLAFDSIETPSGKVDQALGGSVNYFSIAASHYCPVRIVAVVGEDFPADHLSRLRERGIDTQGIEVAKGKTFHWTGSYLKDLNEAQTIETALNVFERFDPKLSPAHQQSDYLFLGNIHPALQLSILRQIKAPKLVVCDTMNYWISSEPALLRQVLSHVDVLSINDKESVQLSGKNNIVAAAAELQTLGPKAVVIKRGEYGAYCFAKQFVYPVPAFPVSAVVDPTGAGDSFAGAFVGSLAATGLSREGYGRDVGAWARQLRESVIHGCVMASFTVADFGINRLLSVTKPELSARKQALVEMLSPSGGSGSVV